MVNATPWLPYCQKTDPVPIIQDAKWTSQGQSGRMQKILPPPGLDPWTVQPVASHYTDYAIPAHNTNIKGFIFIQNIQV